MSIDSQLKILFDRWRHLKARGVALTAEQVCVECPELTDRFRDLLRDENTCSFPGLTQANQDTLAATPELLAPSEFSFLDAPQGPDELGRLSTFRILRVLGQGGMGIVFEGEDSALHRRVAVKVLRPEIQSDSLEQRFQQEARLAASLNHDHIVTIYQIGQHADRPFLVMEYLIGESLAQRLERDGWLPTLEALEIIRQAALGLAVAHEHGLIHRDIKPANIWLESDRPSGALKRVKILDFGLARPIVNHNTLSSSGELVGTPSYMAPEQIFGRPLDGRTDLYSLGCTLYACLMGTPPFVKEDTSALLEAVAYEKSPDLENLGTKIPKPAALLLSELLAKDPDARPASAALVARRLGELEAADALAVPQSSRTQLLRATSPRMRARIPHMHAGVWVGSFTILAAALIALAMGLRGFKSDPQDDSAEKVGPKDPPALSPSGPPIKVGVLYSQSGTFAGSERPMAEGVLLAVEEINKSGGVLGRPIETVLGDPRSNAEATAQGAEKLLSTDKVVTLFGCGSSSGRKLVIPVCEKYDSLLMFSGLYEGLEQSPYVVYVGGAPNQQIQPAAKYAFAELHKRKFFLVGSDYVYSYAANEILKDHLERFGATIVGKEYEALGSSNFDSIVEKIKLSNADMVMNTIDGSSNLHFFQAMRRAGLRPDKIPIMWLSVAEEDLNSIPQEDLTGDFIAQPYFQSIKSAANDAFLKLFRVELATRRPNDATETAYSAVYLWKLAVEKANSVDPPRIREALRDQSFEAPEGLITIDPKNLHAWRMARVARIDADLHFEIVDTSPKPLAPDPFPSSRSREAWEAYLKDRYDHWGQKWEGPRR
jgi:urea transport system substrate-binding protein